MKKDNFDKLKKKIMPEFEKDFLSEWRDYMGFTIDQAAEILDISISAWWKWESDYGDRKSEVPRIIKLACLYLMKEKKNNENSKIWIWT